MNIFISPHNDDEVLFGTFTLLRERPMVVVVYDSYTQFRRGDPITAHQRRKESIRAMEILGIDVAFCGLSDEGVDAEECAAALAPYRDAGKVWAPAFEKDGNRHHNLIARVADSLFPQSQRYLTYTLAGKSRGVPVPYQPEWIAKKLLALASYESQIELPATAEFFMNDLHEYYLGG
jgi:LmbE family N-acetylglucosaminyl deacetylase